MPRQRLPRLAKGFDDGDEDEVDDSTSRERVATTSRTSQRRRRRSSLPSSLAGRHNSGQRSAEGATVATVAIVATAKLIAPRVTSL